MPHNIYTQKSLLGLLNKSRRGCRLRHQAVRNFHPTCHLCVTYYVAGLVLSD